MFAPEKHFRRSIRLKEYDYARNGAYFVTVCAYNHQCLFGEIVNGEMQLRKFGQIVYDEWLQTAQLRSNVVLDVFIVMPNHFHTILIINNDDDGRGLLPYAPATFRSPSQTVGAIVRGFKSTATKKINEMRNTPGLEVWQRNYYEHIIRNENQRNLIRQYIVNNPLKWGFDRENPANVGAYSNTPLQDELQTILEGNGNGKI